MRIKWFYIVMASSILGSVGIDSVQAHSSGGNKWWDRSYSWCPDPVGDAAGGHRYEVYEVGYAIENGRLYVAVRTEFPRGGRRGGDSYSNRTRFSPGDLYLNVGGSFQLGNGTVFGIGTTDHSGDLTRDPSDGPWQSVDAGKLYTGANFATGTYEENTTGTPSDGNDSDGINDYPTLIMNYDSMVSGESGFRYKKDGSDKFYYYWVNLDALGLTYGPNGLSDSLQITWSMECGNDLGECNIDGAVPEPATISLLSIGMLGLANRYRRKV